MHSNIHEDVFLEFLVPKMMGVETYCKNTVARLIEQRVLHGEDLLEAAICAIAERTLAPPGHATCDFLCDESDAKKAIARWHGGVYSAAIVNIKNKIGNLRCMVYCQISDQIFFFVIPHHAYSHLTHSVEILFDPDGCGPTPHGKYAKWMVDNFEEMATLELDNGE